MIPFLTVQKVKKAEKRDTYAERRESLASGTLSFLKLPDILLQM